MVSSLLTIIMLITKRSAPRFGNALDLFEVAGNVIVRLDFLRAAEQRDGLGVPAHAHQHLRVTDFGSD
ncbi:MAG: hypothetical protein AAB069_04440, partial [Planctomycetota bacterium]